MLLKVINQLNPLIVAGEAVHRDLHVANVIRGLQDRNVVNGFPEAVVHLKSIQSPPDSFLTIDAEQY